MKHNRMRRLLAGVTAAALLAAPALAAEDTAPAPQMPDAWAVGELADSYAMGLVDDNYTTYIQSTITSEQLSAMTGIVADKLALLELPQRAADTEGLVVDTTRGGVMNALYQEAAAYDIDGVEEGAAAFLTGLGVVRGDQAGGLNEDRPCTYQEAMVMAERLILALYDANDAGSRGLLWKAVNGDNTLYLLGTIHMDRSNVYPLHKSVRDALDASQVVSFELDLNDQEGMALLAQLQAYSDGTTLADHISPELYARVQAAAVSLGMEPNGFDAYKPWALASTFGVLSLQDDTTGRSTRGSTSARWRPTPSRAASSTACPPSTRRPIWTPAWPGTRGCSTARRPTRRPRRWPRPSRSRLPPCSTPGRTGTPMPWRRSTTKRPSSTVMTSSTPSCSPSGTPA